MRKTFLSSFFIDQHPFWRDHRHQLTLQNVQKALTDKGMTLDFVREHLSHPVNPLQKDTRQAVEILYSKGKGTHRKQYKDLLFCLRRGVCTKEYQEAYREILEKKIDGNTPDQLSVSILQELSVAYFTKISLHEFCIKLVHEMAEAGNPWISASNSELFEELQEMYLAINSAPSFLKTSDLKRTLQSLQGEFHLNYDPYVQENVPYLHYALMIAQPDGTKKQVPSLRLGTPTIERFSLFKQKAKINPEFRTFLESYAAAGKQHLYINLQNRKSRYHGFTEAARCHALEELNNEFPRTLITMTLSKNCDFYWQKKEFKDMHSSPAFKEEFKKQLMAPSSGYFIPPSLRQSRFDHVCDYLLEFTHSTFFKSRTLLSHQERLDFIEIFYTLVIEYCLETTGADSYNVSCRDGIDRAGGANALLYYYRLIKSKSEKDLLQLKHLKTILFAPAILVKKRALTRERFDRFVSAAKHLLINQRNTDE